MGQITLEHCFPTELERVIMRTQVRLAVAVGFGFCKLAIDPVPIGLSPPWDGGLAVKPVVGRVDISGKRLEFVPFRPIDAGSKLAVVV